MKWFNVKITAFADVLVQAEDEETASALAFDEIDCGNFETVGGETSEVPPSEVLTHKRHASLVLEDEPE